MALLGATSAFYLCIASLLWSISFTGSDASGSGALQLHIIAFCVIPLTSGFCYAAELYVRGAKGSKERFPFSLGHVKLNSRRDRDGYFREIG